MIGLIKQPPTYQYLEDFICEYGFVRKEQLHRFFENVHFPPKKARSYLNTLRIHGTKTYYDKGTDGYYSCQYMEPAQSQFFAMDKCLWVLLYFLEKVEHHFPIASSFSPSQICMMLEDRSYEIAYCAAGNEAYFNNQLRAARTELLYRADAAYFSSIVEKDDKAILSATRYIVVLEDIQAARQIHSKLISYFVTLDEQNTCTFYTADEIYTMEE